MRTFPDTFPALCFYMRTSAAYLSWSTVSGSLCMQESEEETLAVRVNETELRYKSVEEGWKLVPVCQFAWLMGITNTGIKNVRHGHQPPSQDQSSQHFKR